jgi:hypothetical protein
MSEQRQELVRIDATGTAHPVGRVASQRLRARQGAFRLMAAPAHLVVMRFVGEDGRRDEGDGPIFRLAGELTTAGALCDIVSLVGQAGWKGELVVLDGASSRSIFFEHGHVLSAQSSVEGERLGEVLYRYGALTEAQVAEAAKGVTPDARFGEVAIKLGFITRERLFALMGKQTEEIVYNVLRAGDGMFYFLDTYDEARLSSHQNLSVGALLMEGVRRMDETKYFRERVPSEQHVPARVAGRAAPEEGLQRIHDAIDGVRSVAELCRVVGQGEFEVTQALFQLVQAGCVVVHAPRPTGAAAIVALFNEAIALVFAEVAAAGRAGELREQLASFATGAGVYDALFRGGGPADDGVIDASKIIENIRVLVGPADAESTLAQWLHEYASFALFVSEPMLRGEEGSAPLPLARRVAELITSFAPTG